MVRASDSRNEIRGSIPGSFILFPVALRVLRLVQLDSVSLVLDMVNDGIRIRLAKSASGLVSASLPWLLDPAINRRSSFVSRGCRVSGSAPWEPMAPKAE